MSFRCFFYFELFAIIYSSFVGAVAYLLPQEDFSFGGSHYDFSLIEIHRGAVLVFQDEGTIVDAGDIVGDETGAVHVGPSQTLALTEVSC